MPHISGPEGDIDDDEEIEMEMDTLFDDFDFSSLSSSPDTPPKVDNAGDKRPSPDTDEEDADDFRPPPMTLRQRRISRAQPIPFLNINKPSNTAPIPSVRLTPNQKWKLALKKISQMRDPWAVFHLEEYKTEKAKRYRYNALRKDWVEDIVLIKMENEQFAHGAMRACYRLKKVSNAAHSSWKKAHNYVAKRYVQDVVREVYFEDVRLQMDAKLWGEEYNRHNPPKKVDVFQMSILEFPDREGKPLYHLEHFIEGEYIKYNSNSGFVDDAIRLTPQAFSHFTFERSGHKLIVVDVQGVGDLYTDPQIHTVDGEEYGDGNLGTRGMALFFHSHFCNSICESLGLSQFDLAGSEKLTMKKFISIQKSAATVVRGTEEMCVSPSPREKVDLTKFLRMRTISSCSSNSVHSDSDDREEEPMSPGSPIPVQGISFRPRQRLYSDNLSDSDTITQEEERMAFTRNQQRNHRSSCFNSEVEMLRLAELRRSGNSILGQVHHSLAIYHEMGRFTMNDSEINWEAALFHEEHAARLGILDAIITMGRIYLGIPHDVLVNCEIESTDESTEKGLQYMEEAAEAGDRGSMIFLANAYETGLNLSKQRSRSWSKAVEWYEDAIHHTDTDESGQFDCTMDNPVYMLQAKIASLYKDGGYGLDTDPQQAGDLYNEAAEAATANMKGRLATKWFMLAEEAWGEVEEE